MAKRDMWTKQEVPLNWNAILSGAQSSVQKIVDSHGRVVGCVVSEALMQIFIEEIGLSEEVFDPYSEEGVVGHHLFAPFEIQA